MTVAFSSPETDVAPAPVGRPAAMLAAGAIAFAAASAVFGFAGNEGLVVAFVATALTAIGTLGGSRLMLGLGVISIGVAALITSQDAAWPVAILYNATGGVLAVGALLGGELSFRARRTSVASILPSTLRGIAAVHVRIVAASVVGAAIANTVVALAGQWPGWALVVVLLVMVAGAVGLAIGARGLRSEMQERRAGFVR